MLPRALRLGGGEVRGAVPSTLAPPVDLDDAPPVDLDDGVLLSTLPARPRDRRLALAVILASAVAFCALVPFAQVALTPVWPFIPVYQSALVVNDLITAILLLGQVRIARSPALLTLASGYLFTAAMAVAHTLTFPGLFAPAGLLGAGPQTTAWLYMFWHAGFPLLVIAYALLKSRPGAARWRPRRIGLAVPAAVAAACASVVALTRLATAGQHLLPAIMDGHHYTPAMHVVVSSVWALSLLALMVLAARRPYSVLDLWLIVVMFAWLFDIALAAVLNAGRFDLGFYAGRVYGVLAASFVLILLLVENTTLYARLVDTLRTTRRLQWELERQNEELEAQVQERTQRLLESEKMATMASLLAGVAHELNNPLAVIVGQVGLLVGGATDEAVRARGRKVEQAAIRCVRIIKNFLAMVRRHPPERRDVAVNDLLRDAAEIFAYEFRVAGIEVVWDLAADLPPVWADGHQIQQVAVNLFTNALHAMRESPGRRRLTVTTRVDAERRGVRIVVADTGPGVPEALRERIFEPFYTTKPEGQGTGLGLAICRGIVESHRGTIRLADGVEPGATFVIELPLVRAPAVPATPPASRPAPVVRGKRILVVDDEPEVAAAIADILAQDGHAVEVALNGADALARLARGSYDLIVSDSAMPVLGGVELHRELTRREPRLARRMIFVTGDSLNPGTQEFLARIDAPRLPKPFTVEELQALVRDVLRRLEGGEPPGPGLSLAPAV